MSTLSLLAFGGDMLQIDSTQSGSLLVPMRYGAMFQFAGSPAPAATVRYGTVGASGWPIPIIDGPPGGAISPF